MSKHLVCCSTLPNTVKGLPGAQEQAVLPATVDEDTEGARGLGAVVVRCAWCGRIRHRVGGWRDVPGMELANRPVSHGICDRCGDNFRKQLG
jgi:hypothetical protein